MKFTGQWHGKDHKGEGITVIEYEDGVVIGYFFTYTPGGDPLWLMCVGDRVGDATRMDAWMYEGGSMGDPELLTNHVEIDWGKVDLFVNENDKLQIEFDPLPDLAPPGFDRWTYELEPLYPQGRVLVDAAASGGPRVTLTKIISSSTSFPVDLPVLGAMEKRLSNKYRLDVYDAPLTITAVRTGATNAAIKSAYRPAITGITPGVISPGDHRIIQFTAQGDWDIAGFQSTWLHYTIESKELGTLFDIQLNVRPVQ